MFLIQKCPNVDDVAKAIEGLLYYDRFKSAVHLKQGDYLFEPIEKFDVKTIIKNRDVDNEVELHFEVDRISKLPLDINTAPAWAIHLIHNSSGVCAIVVRIHHVIGDGLSLVSTMSRMFDEFRGGDNDSSPSRIEEAPSKSRISSDTGVLQKTLAGIGGFFHILGLAASAYDSDVKFSSPDKPHLKMTPHRTTVLFPALHLEFIKSIKNAAGTTVNDVMMAITSGAIRRYCQGVNDQQGLSKSVLMRALIPVGIPRPAAQATDPTYALRNYWAFVSCPLPVGVESTRGRLLASQEAMNYVKLSSMAAIQMWMQTHVLPRLPQFLRRKTAYDIFSRHSMVFSNVPGPSQPIHFCGEKVLGLQVVFPNILPQTLIVSYAGEVFMNMVLDTSLVKGAETLLPKYYVEEAMALAKEYNLSTKESEILSRTSKEGVFGVISR
jgi:hypothetical protein